MKFNTTTKGKNTILNYEGEKAYTLSPALELYTAVVTASLSDQFYEKADSKIERIRNLIAQNNPEFVAKLAIYTRKQMYLRSVPLVLAVELAKIHSGDNLVSRMIAQIIERADEITELLAYYQIANQRTGTKKLNKLSKQVQKGIALAFNKFDEYQFAKYNRDTEIKLRDALFLAHPKAKDESQQAIFNKIINGELATPYTWEVELSELGQNKFESKKAKQEAFKAKWEELIESEKMGYMATLRNLRNFLDAGVSESHIEKVARYLANPKAVENSQQLPFRFFSAYLELQRVASVHTSKLLEALENAAQVSAKNIKGFDKNTKALIACDFSGSMQTHVSPKSKVQYFQIGVVLAMILRNICSKVLAGIFGSTWKIINLPQGNILANSVQIANRIGEVGFSTNGYLVIQDLIKKKLELDKVFIFTDCQMWDSIAGNKEHFSDLWNKYKKLVPTAKLYIFDLAGYGQMPISIPQKDVFLIAGWSDKVFEVLEAIENGENALKMIEKIEL
ncbi:MAG: TROVE domain-containing protein [Raineya sp.]|nr:TROVE domain-containing protein [Raineya sp.]MDW8297018.1 TROVE domain-containing protein [Raineya sp.]